MALLGVSEAAERLGVSTRQVQHLVAQGDLRQVARGIVDSTSVECLLAVRGTSHTRAWSGSTAWAAVALLSGGVAEWIGSTQRSRLRSRLRALTSGELVERTRDRAKVTRYAAHTSAGQHLLKVLVHPAQAGLGLAGPDSIDGYLSVKELPGVVRKFGLLQDDGGRATLRATTMDLEVVRGISERSLVLAALDLAESLDIRERRAGLDGLDRALANVRG